MKYIQRNSDCIVRDYDNGIEITILNGDIKLELDFFSSLIYKNVDKCETLLELTQYIHFEIKSYIDITYNELYEEINTFIYIMVQQGAFLCSKKINYQPCNFVSQRNLWCVYFPYLRIALSVSKELYMILQSITVSSYNDILKCPEAPKEVESLLEFLSVPIALNENESYLHTLSRRIVMLPTTACNLNCNYCYAWRSNKRKNNMTKEMVEAGIQYVAINALNSDEPSIDVSFMGGGEPTCNWETLVYSVEYARGLAIENKVPFSATLTTNGVLSDNKIDWIIKNIDNIKISFDGIKEVQDKQRPLLNGSSFEKVSHTLKRLSNAHANFLVRITVTNSSIDKLEASVIYIINNFSPKSIIINPVYICGSCASHGVDSIEYKDVCRVFSKIQNLGVDKNIDIVIPYDKVTYMDVPKTPFCGFQKGNCFLTPEGYLSACSEIDGSDDPRSTVFFYGSWNSENKCLYVNEEKEKQLRNIAIKQNEDCINCSNNIFCPGPCLVRRIDQDTMNKLIELRRDSPIESSFTSDELDLLNKSRHSVESKIQCKMTQNISLFQIIRMLEGEIDMNRLSLRVSAISPEFFKTNGVLRAININTK